MMLYSSHFWEDLWPKAHKDGRVTSIFLSIWIHTHLKTLNGLSSIWPLQSLICSGSNLWSYLFSMNYHSWCSSKPSGSFHCSSHETQVLFKNMLSELETRCWLSWVSDEVAQWIITSSYASSMGQNLSWNALKIYVQLIWMNSLTTLISSIFVKRLIEIIAQIIIDICLHIHISERTPEAYGECIQSLHAKGIIERETSIRLKILVQLRNLIVHQYGKVDYNLIHQAYCSIVHDFSAFQQQIRRHFQQD